MQWQFSSGHLGWAAKAIKSATVPVMDFSSMNVSSCCLNRSNLVASTLFVTRTPVLCTQCEKAHLNLLLWNLTLSSSCTRRKECSFPHISSVLPVALLAQAASSLPARAQWFSSLLHTGYFVVILFVPSLFLLFLLEMTRPELQVKCGPGMHSRLIIPNVHFEIRPTECRPLLIITLTSQSSMGTVSAEPPKGLDCSGILLRPGPHAHGARSWEQLVRNLPIQGAGAARNKMSCSENVITSGLQCSPPGLEAWSMETKGISVGFHHTSRIIHRLTSIPSLFFVCNCISSSAWATGNTFANTCSWVICNSVTDVSKVSSMCSLSAVMHSPLLQTSLRCASWPRETFCNYSTFIAVSDQADFTPHWLVW